MGITTTHTWPECVRKGRSGQNETALFFGEREHVGGIQGKLWKCRRRQHSVSTKKMAVGRADSIILLLF
jgi:hypothetical protein